MRIGCVILAGGKSSRMGSDKALLEINNKTFIKIIMDEFDDLDEKIIARGNNPYIDKQSWIVVSDDYVNCGPIGGIHKALSICKSDALFFTACDMPFVKKRIFDCLSQFIEDYDAVIVKEQNGRIHPLCGIYKKSIYKIVEEQIHTHNYRIMNFLDRINVKYVIVDSIDELLLVNVNTLEDLNRIK